LLARTDRVTPLASASYPTASVCDQGGPTCNTGSRSYVSRILRLALLAPEIVEAILAGTTDQGIVLEQLERPLPMSWEEQYERLCQ
jgi:hypothetical protein